MTTQSEEQAPQPKGLSLSKIVVLGLIVIGVVVAAFAIPLSSSNKSPPSILLPPGHTLAHVLRQNHSAAPAGWHTNLYYLERSPAPFGLKEKATLFVYELIGKIHELEGQTLLRATQRATV